MFRLNCVSCGNAISLDENVYADYKGPIKCNACTAISNIHMEEGKLKSMEFVRIARPDSAEVFVRRV